MLAWLTWRVPPPRLLSVRTGQERALARGRQQGPQGPGGDVPGADREGGRCERAE